MENMMKLEDDAKSMNSIDINNNNDNSTTNNSIDNNQDDRNSQTDNGDGEKAKDKISIKSNDVINPNSQTHVPSKVSVVEKFTSTLPSTSVKQNYWNSANPFVNYMQDCLQRDFLGESDRKNFLKIIGTQWRLMSHDQKQPYVNGATIIKRKQKLPKISTAARGQKRKRSKGRMRSKRANTASKRANKKKLIKPKRREKKRIKRQRLFKNGSESDSASGNESSDNESNNSDEII